MPPRLGMCSECRECHNVESDVGWFFFSVGLQRPSVRSFAIDLNVARNDLILFGALATSLRATDDMRCVWKHSVVQSNLRRKYFAHLTRLLHKKKPTYLVLIELLHICCWSHLQVLGEPFLILLSLKGLANVYLYNDGVFCALIFDVVMWSVDYTAANGIERWLRNVFFYIFCSWLPVTAEICGLWLVLFIIFDGAEGEMIKSGV